MWENNEILETVCDTVERKIRRHHEDFRMPLRAEYIEDALSQGFKKAGLQNDWYGGDHGKGADIFMPEDVNCDLTEKGEVTGISVKSNVKRQLDPIRVDISGSRLTRFDEADLDSEEVVNRMINYLANERNYDWYALSTRRKPTEKRYKEMNYEEYEIYMIPADIIDPTAYEWEEDNDGWKATIEKGFHLRINESQSMQFWIDGIPYEMIEKYSIRTIRIDNVNEI